MSQSRPWLLIRSFRLWWTASSLRRRFWQCDRESIDGQHVSWGRFWPTLLSKFWDASIDICYLYRYVERNGRSPGNPWSIRQTGVYHRYSPTDVSNFWLLLHPLVDSMAQKRLNKLYSTQNSFVHLKANALGLHILLISSYSDNWRWYLKDLGIAFTKIVRSLPSVVVRSHKPGESTYSRQGRYFNDHRYQRRLRIEFCNAPGTSTPWRKGNPTTCKFSSQHGDIPTPEEYQQGTPGGWSVRWRRSHEYS